MLSRRFQKMRCIFRGRRSTLETSDVILRGRRSTFDVSCCVFVANRIVSAGRSGDRMQIPWQAWHFVTRDETWWKARTKRRFWGRSIRKLVVGKHRFRTYELKRFEDVSHEMLILMPQHASVASPCLCGKRGTSWNFHVSANVSKIVLCRRCNTFASLSKDDLHFSWQWQHLLQPQQFRLVVFRAFVNRNVRAAQSRHTQHSTLHTLLHFTLHTLHFTPHTWYSTLYTLHSTHRTFYSTLYTWHLTPPFSSLATMIPGFVITSVSIRVCGLHLVWIQKITGWSRS